ncbi:hypothetical protein [Candidatus Venteria ishoeyi]|uniref:Uncharacterized protein n=1 Tax=Candidatus Venteria ishoeyi TaxID=1899563 RepID=A0A1H6FFT9_9GAMM|nr:hypothetical protein [Candidatus Venteria ishoeyi]SEH08897.1 Uncharacterised protein [Candidatus Venteria ishoeyi]
MKNLHIYARPRQVALYCILLVFNVLPLSAWAVWSAEHLLPDRNDSRFYRTISKNNELLEIAYAAPAMPVSSLYGGRAMRIKE